MTSGQDNGVAGRLAPNIKAARKAAGLTQLAVAIHLDIQPVAVSRWERGESAPAPENLAAFARLVGRQLAWFYTDHEAAA